MVHVRLESLAGRVLSPSRAALRSSLIRWLEPLQRTPDRRSRRARHRSSASSRVSHEPVACEKASLTSFRVAHLSSRVYRHTARSEEHTSELQSLMRLSYAVFCLKQKNSRMSTK